MQNPDANVNPPPVQEDGLGKYAGVNIDDLPFLLAEDISPGLPRGALGQAIDRTLKAISKRRDGSHPFSANRHLELKLLHACKNTGCEQLDCRLCRHNPNKRCTNSIAPKQVVGEVLLSPCEGAPYVALYYANGEQYMGNVSAVKLQVYLVDAKTYDGKWNDALDLQNFLNEHAMRQAGGGTTLAASSATNDAAEPHLVLEFQEACHAVPLEYAHYVDHRGGSLKVMAAPQRAQQSFRLLLYPVSPDGARYTDLKHTVSDEFVLIPMKGDLQRQNIQKRERDCLLPMDSVVVLPHIGPESASRLARLKELADEKQLVLPGLPDALHRVKNVSDFAQLAECTERDGTLRKAVLQLLGKPWNSGMWEAACAVALVHKPDAYLRLYSSRDGSSALIYSCEKGQLNGVEALLTFEAGLGFWMIRKRSDLSADEQRKVGTIHTEAVARWADWEHPGWSILKINDELFENINHLLG